MSRRIAVLASGGGSNLTAIFDHLVELGAKSPGEVVLVASDRSKAGALARARQRGIEAVALDSDRRDEQLGMLLESRSIDVVALAGYLRMVPAGVTAAWRGRLLNVHPSLLPAFGGRGMYGRRVHEAVLAHGVRVTGVTVHFVDDLYDHGPIVAQWPVPVLPGDDAASLAARVLEAVHRLYPVAVAGVAGGQVVLGPDGRVRSADPGRVEFRFTAEPVSRVFGRGGAPPPGG